MIAYCLKITDKQYGHCVVIDYLDTETLFRGTYYWIDNLDKYELETFITYW